MHFLSFWKAWPASYRVIWYALAVAFIISLLFMWTSYFVGPSAIIDWEKVQEQKAIETTIDVFRLGPFQINVPAESYVILEYFSGGEVMHNFTSTYLFLALFAAAVVALLTISTKLDTIWYLVASTLFIVLFVSLRFEALFLFGQRGMVIPLAILGVYLVASFYFKYYRSSTSFTTRLLVFSGITLVLFLLIFFTSGVTFPFMHLLVTAYPAALILSIYFIVVVAHEILVAFVYLASNQGSGQAGAKHFSIFSLLYLLYIILTALHEIGAVQWNIVFFNIYLLLTISAILGVWGYRLREPQYEGIFSFHPYGAFFYLAIGALCFSTIGQLLGNWNDAALKVIRDIIIFSHTGFGIIFVMYFMSNFAGMMSKDIPVYPLLYKPNRMPFFTFRFTGLIATLAFVFYSEWKEYVYHSEGGYYNYVADLYKLQGDERMAMIFYDQSRSRAFQNNRANYALGKLRSQRLDVERAHNNYQLANGKRPTEYSLTNAGNLYFWTTDYFDAIREFRKGKEVLPGSEALSNNLGYAYAKVHNLDSSIYFLNDARESGLTKGSAEANFLATAALEYIPVKADSILTIFESTEPIVFANAVAVATLFGQELKNQKDPLPQEPLDLYSATYLNNYIVRNVSGLDTAWIRRAYALATDTTNIAFRGAIRTSLSYAYYQKGLVYKALEILGELAYIAQNFQGTFNYTMGLWALEQGDPVLAASYFLYADDADFKKAKFYRTIALTESGDLGQAILGWDSLRVRDNDPAIRVLSEKILKVLNTQSSQVRSLTDAEKYQYCRYRLGVRDTTTINAIVNSFENVNYKGQILLDISQKLYDADYLIPAIQYLNKTSGLQLTDKTLFDNIRHHELLMLSSRGEIRLIASQINKGVEFDEKRQLEKILYTALIAEASGDVERAETMYKFLAHANPFFEDGILAAAEFYKRKDKASIKPYEILTESIYLNPRSIRLVKAYAAEAARQGFDEYATSAESTLRDLQRNLR